MSEDATLWVSAALGVMEKLRGTLKVQNACLDEHEEAGLIQQ